MRRSARLGGGMPSSLDSGTGLSTPALLSKPLAALALRVRAPPGVGARGGCHPPPKSIAAACAGSVLYKSFRAHS
eukprot:scaffold161988_cov34-Tisochrysis_lutea.AAC.3